MLRCRSILVLLLIDGILVPQQGTFFLVETKSMNSKSLYHYINGVFRHGNAWSFILHQFLFYFLSRPFPTQPSGGMCWLSSLHRNLPVLLLQCSGLSSFLCFFSGLTPLPVSWLPLLYLATDC